MVRGVVGRGRQRTAFVLRQAVLGRIIGEGVAEGNGSCAVFFRELIRLVIAPRHAAGIHFQDLRSIPHVIILIVVPGNIAAGRIHVGQDSQLVRIIVSETSPRAVGEFFNRSATSIVITVRGAFVPGVLQSLDLPGRLVLIIQNS